MSISSEITRITNARNSSFTSVANKGVTVPSGSTIDDLPNLIDAIPTGGGSVITVVDTIDTHGGTIRTITAVDISDDTVTAEHLQSGYTAHDALGNAITGTLKDKVLGTLTVTPSMSQQTFSGGDLELLAQKYITDESIYYSSSVDLSSLSAGDTYTLSGRLYLGDSGTEVSGTGVNTDGSYTWGDTNEIVKTSSGGTIFTITLTSSQLKIKKTGSGSGSLEVWNTEDRTRNLRIRKQTTVGWDTVTVNAISANRYYRGTTYPSAYTGSDGDLYYQTSYDRLFKKISGTWTVQTDLSAVFDGQTSYMKG